MGIGGSEFDCRLGSPQASISTSVKKRGYLVPGGSETTPPPPAPAWPLAQLVTKAVLPVPGHSFLKGPALWAYGAGGP